MKNVLVIAGHPHLEKSIANKTILAELEKEPGYTVRKLQETGKGGFNIAEEQKALSAADIIVFQFPFYWYAYPALMKGWLDEVFSYGFAYGADGNKLAGKTLVVSMTSGGPESAYANGAPNNYTYDELTTNIRQTANLTGMTYAEPVISGGMMYVPGVAGDPETVRLKAIDHAKTLKQRVASL